MLFNSHEFIFVFLPISFFVYFYLNKKRLTSVSKLWLIFSSLFFYSWWDINYLPLILGSIIFNYSIGQKLHYYSNSKKIGFITRKTILIIGIALNLSLLAYFKYVGFFIENINYTFGAQINIINLTLPLAISFFTFQQITYLVDSFRRETEGYDFLNYAVFVSFFPQLIAGPIVHHREMMPQFNNIQNKTINFNNISLGMFIFSVGLFKKVVLADTFSIWATNGFDVAETLNFFEAWATSLSYTFQLYFDFSGYADMAIGAALLFNIKLPINFNSPYKALNIQDFWRRWHMTLSRFLKESVYIPLGGNRRGSFRTYNNLLATFIIGGIWHGAGWMFIFWGFIHGISIVINRLWHLTSIKIPSFFAWFITFNFVNIAWIFFRAKDLNDALKVVTSMFNLHNFVLPSMLENKMYFLNEYGVKFGGFIDNIKGDTIQIKSNILFYFDINSGNINNAVNSFYIFYIVGFLMLGFVIVICFRNINNYKINTRSQFLCSSILVLIAITQMGKKAEFLYFNF